MSQVNRVLKSALFEDFYPFKDLFEKCEVAHFPVDLTERDCLLLWGGGDISPSLYGEKPGSHTGATEVLSTRDQWEVDLARQAMKLGIPIIGICRGAQLMCALAGGKVIQHVNGHGVEHLIKTVSNLYFWTSSLHHQMMYPWEIDHNLLAYASPPRSNVYLNGDDRPVQFPDNGPIKLVDCEPEVVWFPSVKCIAIQGHPEFMRSSEPFVVYCRQLVEKYCGS